MWRRCREDPAHPHHRRRRHLRRRPDARGHPGRAARRPLGHRPDHAMGRQHLAGGHRRRGAGLQRRQADRRPQAAQAHPPRRRLRPVCRRPAIEQAGFAAWRDTLDEAGGRALCRRHRRLRRLRRRHLRQPVRLLPADRRGQGRAEGLRPGAGGHRQPAVAAALAAQQRARPCRHPPGAEGTERLHHPPQHQRPAGAGRGHGRAARRRMHAAPWWPRTRRRSSRRCCCTTSSWACCPRRRCGPSTRATTAARWAKARRH